MLGRTQRAIAEAAHCAEITVRKLEAGDLQPSQHLWQALVAAYQLDPAQHAHIIGRSVDGNPLPPLRSALVGRDADLAELRALLAGRARLMTLTGPGGVGKTSLALHLAHAMRTSYLFGAAFVPLADVQHAAAVLPALLASLHVTDVRSGALDALIGHLQDRQQLLVLDNFEHVMQAQHVIETILRFCPSVTMIVTSRTRIRLPDAHEFVVQPLPASSPDGDNPAVTLFVQRAQMGLPGYQPSATDVAAITEICRRVDGLPLAIELVAARTQLMAPRTLLERLSQPADGPLLAMITEPGGTGDKRPRALYDTIAWSHRLLSREERRLLGRLAVFQGGWTLPAAEAVGMDAPAIGDEATAELWNHISTLLDKSLIQRITTDEGVRFSMLETIRAFALAAAENAGMRADAVKAHATYFSSLAQHADGVLDSAGREAGLRQLRNEHANVRAALAHLLAAAEHAPQQAGPALALTLSLWRYWRYGTLLHEGAEHCARAAALALSPDAVAGLRMQHAQVQTVAGLFAGLLGRTSEARDRCLRALDAFAATGAPELGLRAHAILGELHADLGEPVQARLHFERAIVLAEAQHDAQVLAYAHNGLGEFERVNGRLAEAGANYARAYTAAVAGGPALARERAVAGSNVCANQIAAGHFMSEPALIDEALGYFQQTDDTINLAVCLMLRAAHTARALNTPGARAAALAEYAHAEQLARASGGGFEKSDQALLAALRADST